MDVTGLDGGQPRGAKSGLRFLPHHRRGAQSARLVVRDHRFDQDAIFATVEKLIQSGAAGGYALTRLVGHHMDWLFLDKPAT